MRSAERAERIALAVVNGAAADSDVMNELRLANRETEVIRNAVALRAYRNGDPIWAWPSVTPWHGF